MAWVDKNILGGEEEFGLLEDIEQAGIALGAKEPGAMDLWNAALVDLKDVIESLQRENNQLRRALVQRGISGVANVNLN